MYVVSHHSCGRTEENNEHQSGHVPFVLLQPKKFTHPLLSHQKVVSAPCKHQDG